MLNQGYYNLFLGIGAIVGAVLVPTDVGGRTTLLGYCCLFMLGAAVVLVVGSAVDGPGCSRSGCPTGDRLGGLGVRVARW